MYFDNNGVAIYPGDVLQHIKRTKNPTRRVVSTEGSIQAVSKDARGSVLHHSFNTENWVIVPGVSTS